MRADRLAAIRAEFALSLARAAGRRDEALIAAFSRVERENFVGPGPWEIAERSIHGFRRSADDDPKWLYVDALVRIAADRGINNGEPGLHYLALAALAARAGDRVAHVGAGTGYYSAILAELVGPSGLVDAYEAEPDLEARARACLAPWPWTRVHGAARAANFGGPYEAIYVSAAATAPRPEWLAGLAEGGRLVFPLTSERRWGVMLKLTREGTEFAAEVICGAAFIPLAGGFDAQEGRAVHDALVSGSLRRARRLVPPPAPEGAEVVVAWRHAVLIG